jgi:broad-specificity NMP kinase
LKADVQLPHNHDADATNPEMVADAGANLSDMGNVLITGLAGTGKSAVVRELQRRGLDAIDTGNEDWCEWRRVRPTGSDELGPRDEWLWQEDRMADYLAELPAGMRFVGGCAANQGMFRTVFDHVILLVASPARMVERLEPRWDLRFASDRFERYQVLQSVDRVLPLLRETATHEIDTTNCGVSEVVDRIIDIGQAPASMASDRRLSQR